MSEHPDDESGIDPVIDPELEAEVRTALRRAIVPPATPGPVRDAVEAMATNHGARTGVRWRVWQGASALASLAAVVVVLAVIAASLAVRGGKPAAATPQATLGTPGPVLPDAKPGQTPAVGFGWTGQGLTAWATGTDGLRFTEDGGVMWSAPVSLPAVPDASLASLDFVDRDNGWQTFEALQAGVWHLRVQRTDDGGLTWQTSEIASLPDQTDTGLLTSTHFSDASHGVTFVSRPVETPGASEPPLAQTYASCTKYVTVDGGATWTGPTASVCNTIESPRWVNRLVGFDPGGDASSPLSVTTDGGLTWRTSGLPGVSSSQDVFLDVLDVDAGGRLHLLVTLLPASMTWVAAPLVRYVSVDGGATWAEEFRSTTPSGTGAGWMSVLAPDHYMALVGGLASRSLIESRDGGRTWSDVQTSGFDIATYMYWADEMHGMLEGIRDCSSGQTCDTVGSSAGGVFLTDDGGRTWHQLAFPPG